MANQPPRLRPRIVMADSTQDAVKQVQSMDDSSSIGVSGLPLISNDAGAGDARPGSGVEEQKIAATAQTATAASQYDTNSTGQDSAPQEALINGQSESLANNPDSQSPSDPTQTGPFLMEQPGGEQYQHLISETANANGIDSASYAGSEDNSYQRSTGSDHDTPRSDGQGQDMPEGSWRRERSGSFARRATGFKSVSVTKNYLAKTGGSASSTPKPGGDRVPLGSSPATATPGGLKPRLVAKLGKDSRTASLGSTVRVGGPDASKVWNRNQAVPAPPPKQFTDEELKQQYGIHLATRLQADEAGQDGKWADIDDEDDWAPEAIQWVDGTRSSVAPPELLPKPVQNVLPQLPQGADESLEPKLSQPQGASSSSLSSAGKTILKPGARLNSHTKPGLVLRSVPESPVPLNRPTPTGSNRSPWASLPPVDKASPVSFVPPAHLPQPFTFSRRGSSAIDDLPVPSPAKEIAADDFDRSWRENDRSGQTLFNSQSGRYEPVKSSRRLSRNESGVRPSSVLQRPSHGQGEVNGASGTFLNQESQGWSRRRDSSFSSIDQGPAKPPIVPATSISPAPQEPPSPTEGRQTYTAHATTEADPHTVQQQLMRQRIELNRKRKQEEEALEEEAKQERIRARLAKLEPASSKSSDGKSVGEDQISADKSLSDATMSQTQVAEVAAVEAATSHQPSNHTNIASPPKAISHQHLPNEKISGPASTSLPLSRSQPSFQNVKPSTSQKLAKAASDSSAPMPKSPELQHLPGLGQAPAVGHEKTQQSWGRMPSTTDATSSWSNRPTPTGNLWGPPTTDRGFGNGAFNNNMHQMPAANLHAQLQAPSPVGTPYSDTFISPQPTPSPPIVPMSYDENVTRSQTQFISQPTPNRSTRRVTRLPRDASTGLSAWHHFSTNPNDYDKVVDDDATERTNRRFETILAEKQQQLGQRAVGRNDVRGEIKETQFRIVNDGGERLTTKAILDSPKTFGDRFGSGPMPNITQQSVQGGPLHPVPNGRASRFFGPGVDRGQPAQEIKAVDNTSVSVRSNSPPPPDNAGHPAFMGVSQHPHVRLPGAKPKVRLPPPQMEQSLADTQQLGTGTMPTKPANRGQPIAQSSDWQARFNGLFGRSQVPRPQAGSPSGTAPVTANSSPQKQAAAPISSSSKAALDVSVTHSAATVSLPATSEAGLVLVLPPSLGERRMETKATDEELMDDREFGSSPTVRVYNGIHPRAYGILKPMPRIDYDSDISVAERDCALFEKTVTCHLSFHDLDSQHSNGFQHKIYVRMLGQPEKVKVMERTTPSHAEHAQFLSQRGNSYKKKIGQRKVSTTTAQGTAQSPNPRSPAIGSSRLRTQRSNAAEEKPAASSPQQNPKPQQETSADQSKQPQSGHSKSSWAKPPKGRQAGYQRGPSRQQVAT